MERGSFFVTTPIYYINDAPHIGHAYTTIAADILSRYWKKRGAEVFFLTGTDEHGSKVSQAAQKKGIKPKKFADEMAMKYKAAWSYLNIEYDNFIRTTDPQHEKFVQDFLQKLYDNGEIFKDKYSGLYCVGCEEYKVEKELGEGNTCPIHKTKCDLVEEDIYFFKLSKYQDQLMELIQSKKLVIEPEKRKNEVWQFLAKEPLRDLAISRTKVPWGIHVPWDKSQTIYVWFDALLNYISASRGLWPPSLQLMAKDIFRFHAIIWPALLLASGYEIPEQLFIHGYFTINGVKMSKTIGNVIDPIELSKVYGVDALRYFIFREVPFGEDGDFSIDRFESRYKADLANDLGNLVQRVIALAAKYNIDWDYLVTENKYTSINDSIENLKFSEALNSIWMLISEANKQIDLEKPWDLVKTNPEKFKLLINGLMQVLADISNLIQPFMPETSRKIIDQLKSKNFQPLFPRKK